MSSLNNEERNVLDDLLDNGEDEEDFDAELRAAKIDKQSRSKSRKFFLF